MKKDNKSSEHFPCKTESKGPGQAKWTVMEREVNAARERGEGGGGVERKSKRAGEREREQKIEK